MIEMNKQLVQAVSVRLDRRNRPAAFEWRGRIYRVEEVQECWRLAGAWWDGEDEKTFFRVGTDKGGIYELRFDHGSKTWRLDVVQD